MNQILTVKDLQKKYNNFTLGPINTSFKGGVIIGLIGENGAGKTTFIKSILGIIKSTGKVEIFGHDISTEEKDVKENIGVVLDNSFFPEVLTANDIDKIMNPLYKNWDPGLFYNLLERFSIPKNKTIKTLSKGMRKKLEIAAALAHHPKFLLLDEPTSGLDPVVRKEVLDVFLDFIQDEKHTILLSTHITSDLERIADYILFLNHGQIVLEETKDDIMENYGILKCGINDFSKVAKEDIIRFIKNKYNYEILVKNPFKLQKKYPEMVMDKLTLEDLMVLIVKGCEA